MIDTPMMKLARAVYPQHQWDMYGRGPCRPCVSFVEQIANTAMPFDPANNDAQAIDVLCWLLNTDPIAHWELTTDGKQTAPSIRAAILAAALRVVGNEQNTTEG